MKTTRTGPWRGAAALLIALAAAGCAGKPRLSDTGYEGTWGRGNERIRSTIAIARDGERWLVRIGVRSSDGSYAVRCGWDGLCEEIQDGERIYDHRFVTSVDPESGCQESDDAGFAGLLPGIALVEAARGSPRLHGAHQAQQQGRHISFPYGREAPVHKLLQRSHGPSQSLQFGLGEIEDEGGLLATERRLERFGLPCKLLC